MSSTAVELAIDAIPGRVTVHIWSSVRSVKDCNHEHSTSAINSNQKTTLISD